MAQWSPSSKLIYRLHRARLVLGWVTGVRGSTAGVVKSISVYTTSHPCKLSLATPRAADLFVVPFSWDFHEVFPFQRTPLMSTDDGVSCVSPLRNNPVMYSSRLCVSVCDRRWRDVMSLHRRKNKAISLPVCDRVHNHVGLLMYGLHANR